MKARLFLLTATIGLTALFFGYSQYLTAASSAISNLLSSSPENFSHQENQKPPATTLQVSIDDSISTATITPPAQSARQKKTVLLKYIQWPGDGVDEIISCIAGWGPLPQVILFDDGQLVQSCCRCGYSETYLSQQEIDDLFQRIKETGFFNLPLKPGSIEDRDIYKIPEGVEFGDGGWGITLVVKNIEIDIHPQKAKYLIKPIQDTRSIITSFQAKGKMNPYVPDEVYLYILNGENPDIQEYFSAYLPKQEATISSWPSELPYLQLEENGDEGYGLFNQKEIAASLKLNVFSHFPEVKRFKQGGQTYIVIPCISSIE